MTEKERNDEVVELDILEVLRSIWEHKYIIFLLCFVCMTAMFVKTMFFTEDTYTATGMIFVRNKSETQALNDTAISQSDINTSRTLSTTFIELIKTKDFLQDVVDMSGVSGMSWEGLKRITSVSVVNDTELLKISVTTNNPETAYKLANGIVENAPKMLTRFYEAGKAEAADSVLPPARPDGKGTVKNTLIGFLVGLVLGCAYAVLYMLFDTKVHASADIAKKYEVSILGDIGQIAPTVRTGKNGKKEKLSAAEQSMMNILDSHSDFDTVETFKSIRTNIMFSIPKSNDGKVIVVTSSAPSEGKTTTTINLAITFAQTARVIILDCDLRKSRVHRYLGIERQNGISNVLCGFLDLDSAIKSSNRENLDVLTAGEIPPNPAELLETDAFTDMINELKKRYDYIFIDTPPLSVVTDASVIMPRSHGVVVIARQNVTTYDLLDITMDSVKKAGAKLFGVVVLDSYDKQKKYGYYKNGNYRYKYKNGYKYGYKYKYGYEYHYGDDPDELETEQKKSSN